MGPRVGLFFQSPWTERRGCSQDDSSFFIKSMIDFLSLDFTSAFFQPGVRKYIYTREEFTILEIAGNKSSMQSLTISVGIGSLAQDLFEKFSIVSLTSSDDTG